MDFQKVLTLVHQEFGKHGIQYALMGGFAMGALGVARATIDIDLLILADDKVKVRAVLESLGYACAYESENVSQYTSHEQVYGEIDCIHAFRGPSLKMLARAKQVSVFSGTYTVNVLLPEDIIGLKLQASVNDPSRKEKEMQDIESLAQTYGKKLDWSIVQEHYGLFEKNTEYMHLKERYGNL